MAYVAPSLTLIGRAAGVVLGSRAGLHSPDNFIVGKCEADPYLLPNFCRVVGEW